MIIYGVKLYIVYELLLTLILSHLFFFFFNCFQRFILAVTVNYAITNYATALQAVSFRWQWI